MKGKTGDKGKKNAARALESTTRTTSTARTTSMAKAMWKAKKKERKAKEKDKERRRNQHPTRASKATASHVASGSTRRVSVGKVTCKQWRKFRGSVSTACPYAWCSDISVNDKEKAYLQDIQQRRILSHGSRVVPLELWGLQGRVECKVKFDVAGVAYPVVSLGKMIESSFTFIFDDYKCYMHQDNKRVEIFRQGRIFVLKMRRRWLKSTAHMVAPIDEIADEKMVSLMMEKEQWTHVRTSQVMIHHHHHENGKVRCDQEQNLCGNTI